MYAVTILASATHVRLNLIGTATEIATDAEIETEIAT